MLTKRQNMMEVVRKGNPDRYVSQYEAVKPLRGDLINAKVNLRPTVNGPAVADAWGVYRSYPDNVPGPFPLHDDEHRLLFDIEDWRDVVKKPQVKFPASEWEACQEAAEQVDRNDVFLTLALQPGVFEATHYFMGMEDALVNYMVEPEEMMDLVKYVFEYEMEIAEEYVKYLHPDCIFHHDDWGSRENTFLRPEMFEEFFLEGYKELYGWYKDHGVELICHHSDSYAATLVPYMIEMGVDVWQGCMQSNNLPELCEKYGDKITFMGGVDCELVDIPDWTPELIEQVVTDLVDQMDKKHFIPCISQGGPIATYPGVYDCIDATVAKINHDRFGVPETI